MSSVCVHVSVNFKQLCQLRFLNLMDQTHIEA